MKNFNLILLAGGKQKPLYEVTKVENKAQIPIHGKPMIEWVLDAFLASGRIAETVVAEPRTLDALPCIEKVRKRVHGGSTVLESLTNAVGCVKMHVPLQEEEVHQGYLISFGDAVFLNEKTIHAVLENIDRTDPDIALHYVERGTYERAGLPLTRTFIPIGEGRYTGTTIYYTIYGLVLLYSPLRKRLLNTAGSCQHLAIGEPSVHFPRRDAVLRRCPPRFLRAFHKPCWHKPLPLDPIAAR